MGLQKASHGNKAGVKQILHCRIVPLNIKVGGGGDAEADTLLPGATYNSFSCLLLRAPRGCQSRCTIGGVPIYVAAVSSVIYPAVAHQNKSWQMSLLNHEGTFGRSTQMVTVTDYSLAWSFGGSNSTMTWTLSGRAILPPTVRPNVILFWVLSVSPPQSHQLLMEDCVSPCCPV